MSKRGRPPLTQQQRDLIVILANDGLSPGKIADTLDICTASVSKYMRLAGLPIAPMGYWATKAKKERALPPMDPSQKYKYRVLRQMVGREKALDLVLP